MSEIPFYKTRMGHRFYEHTVPEMVRQLERVNDLLERLVERLPLTTPADGPPESNEQEAG